MKTDARVGVTSSQSMLFSVLLFILLVALFYAGKWGGASVSHEIAMFAYHGWVRNNVIPDADKLAKAERLLGWSIAMDSANAKYFYDRGRLYTFSALAASHSKTRRTFLLLKAVGDFRKATQLRPYWPVAWAALALAKSSLGAIDQEYVDAVKTALLRGEFRISIYPIVIESGLNHWDKLSPEVKKSILTLIRFGMGTEVKKDIILTIQASDMCESFAAQGVFPKRYCSYK